MREPWERRYSDEESDRILARAIELQDQSDELAPGLETRKAKRSGTPDGMTLRTLREIAAEVGVDARFVEEAALSFRRRAAPGGLVARLFGGPIRFDVGGRAEGRLAPSARSELVDELRREMGHEGEVREAPSSVEWSTVGRLTRTTVAIRDQEDGTAIQVRVDASGIAAFTWLGSVAVGLLAGGVVVTAVEPATAVGAMSIVAVGGGVGAGFARAAWSRVSRFVREAAGRLRDRILRLSTV